MKRFVIFIFLFASFGLLGGCCTDDMGCGGGTVYQATPVVSTCNTCNTCSTCGYDASYTYSGWY